jgi:hypothetical protein
MVDVLPRMDENDQTDEAGVTSTGRDGDPARCSGRKPVQRGATALGGGWAPPIPNWAKGQVRIHMLMNTTATSNAMCLPAAAAYLSWIDCVYESWFGAVTPGLPRKSVQAG